MEYNCEYRPLEMKLNCSSELIWVLFDPYCWETVQQIILDEDHDCFRKFSNTFVSEGSPIFLPNLGSIFSRIISFVLKMIIFSYMA